MIQPYYFGRPFGDIPSPAMVKAWEDMCARFTTPEELFGPMNIIPAMNPPKPNRAARRAAKKQHKENH